ncbi:MAG: hypothetical protein MHM6MM_003847 [Cercozoa sp. M6MM]
MKLLLAAIASLCVVSQALPESRLDRLRLQIEEIRARETELREDLRLAVDFERQLEVEPDEEVSASAHLNKYGNWCVTPCCRAVC